MPGPKKTDPEEEPSFEDALDVRVPPPTSTRAARYKVLSSGLTGTDGAHYAGEEVTAEQLGDAARIDRLLNKQAIEAI